MSIRGRLKFSGFCLFMTFAMLVMSSVLIWCAGQQNLDSPITIVFEASKVSLTFAQNDGSVVTPDNCAIVKSADGTQFKIVGPTPILTSTTASANETSSERTTTSGTTRTATASSGPTGKVSAITDLANSDGAEFYYFCTNSAVTSTTGYTDPGTIYWTSTADSTLESWYDIPSNKIALYACFMKPNFTGAEVDTDNKFTGSSTSVIISNSIKELSGTYFSGDFEAVVIPNSVEKISYAGWTSSANGGESMIQITGYNNDYPKIYISNNIKYISGLLKGNLYYSYLYVSDLSRFINAVSIGSWTGLGFYNSSYIGVKTGLLGYDAMNRYPDVARRIYVNGEAIIGTDLYLGKDFEVISGGGLINQEFASLTISKDVKTIAPMALYRATKKIIYEGTLEEFKTLTNYDVLHKSALQCYPNLDDVCKLGSEDCTVITSDYPEGTTLEMAVYVLD